MSRAGEIARARMALESMRREALEAAESIGAHGRPGESCVDSAMARLVKLDRAAALALALEALEPLERAALAALGAERRA